MTLREYTMSSLDEKVPSRTPAGPGDTAFTPTIDVLRTHYSADKPSDGV